jgi:hypothetical protein
MPLTGEFLVVNVGVFALDFTQSSDSSQMIDTMRMELLAIG